MSGGWRSQWNTKINPQHVSLRKIVEEKVRGKVLEEVWSDENGWTDSDSGMKDRDERSDRGGSVEILIVEGLAKIKPTEP
jgi:hypothetical protein